MFPEHDPYWTQVRDFILSAADTNAVLMAPTEFLEYFPNAYHYHVDTLCLLTSTTTLFSTKECSISWLEVRSSLSLEVIAKSL